MFRKLLNTILLANGISTPDDSKTNSQEDKWAERRRKYGERPWEDRRLEAQGKAVDTDPADPADPADPTDPTDPTDDEER